MKKRSYEIYEQKIAEVGVSTYRVAMKARVPQCAFSRWKTRGIVPKYQSMRQIADALTDLGAPVTAEDFYNADMEGGEGNV